MEENEGDVDVANSSGQTAGHKRQQWWKAHQRTDERNVSKVHLCDKMGFAELMYSIMCSFEWNA